jgi:ABC-type nitrate/sulfonate/bicarbonate transport system substrate-binding protein
MEFNVKQLNDIIENFRQNEYYGLFDRMSPFDLDRVIWGAPSFWIERFPLYCGCHFGFFRDQGIELEIWYSYGGPELARAVAIGDINIGDMGLPPFVKAYSEGLPARIIGSSPIQQLDHYLVGTPPVETMADLRGKQIGILSPGSCDDYFLSHLLRSQGIDPEKEVERVPLGTRYGELEVFGDGTVDAAFMVEPGVAAGEFDGLFKVIGRVGDYFPRYQWGVILAGQCFAERFTAICLTGRSTRVLILPDCKMHLIYKKPWGLPLTI